MKHGFTLTHGFPELMTYGINTCHVMFCHIYLCTCHGANDESGSTDMVAVGIALMLKL